MFGNVKEIAVGSQQREPMLNARRGNQAVSGRRLHAFGAAMLAQGGCGDIGVPFERKKGKRIEQAFEPVEIFLLAQAVQKFLQDSADQEDTIVGFKVGAEGLDQRMSPVRLRPAEDEGPDRRINDEIHDPVGLPCSPSCRGSGRFRRPSGPCVAASGR